MNERKPKAETSATKQKKTRNFSKSQKALIKHIETITAGIPSGTALDIALSKSPQKYILKYGNAHPLIIEWVHLRKISCLVGKTLKARFGGGGGNPALRAKESGRIDEISYSCLIYSVNYYDDLFAVIQTGWEYIKFFLKEVGIQDYPKDECEYFLKVLCEDFDNRLLRFAEGDKAVMQHKERQMRKIRNLLWATPLDKWINDSSFPEPPQWCSFKRYFWLGTAFMVLDICSKEDDVLLSMLNRLRHTTANFADELARILERERKNPTGRIKSLNWENTLLYHGAKGGWNLAS